MFKPIRKKINEIDRTATEALLMSNRRGILAMNGDNGYPYAIPINYFYDIETLVQGKDAIMARRAEITQLRAERSSSNKDEGLWDIFEIALEMIERGFHFNPVSLEYSQASKFILDPNDEKGLIPPFSAIDALGESVAKTVVDARADGPFLSKEDVIKRTKLNNSHIKTLSKMGVFNGMQERNQLSLF